MELHVLCPIRYYYSDKISEDNMSRTCVETGENAYIVLMGEMKERCQFEDLGVYGRTISKKWGGRPWTVLMWFRMGKSCA